MSSSKPTVVFSRSVSHIEWAKLTPQDLNDKDMWDDQALIETYNKSIELYK